MVSKIKVIFFYCLVVIQRSIFIVVNSKLVNFKKLNFNDYLLYRQLKNHSPDLGDSVVFDLKKQFSQQNTAQHKKLCIPHLDHNITK